MPLHVFCVLVMGLFASLSAAGVYGLTRELTGEIKWAVFAAVLYAFIIANYRTIGFILIREDVGLPLFAMHLWLLARALRLGTVGAIAAAAIALVLALATWHANRMVVTIEAACIFAWYLRTAQNPLSATKAWLFAAILVLSSLIVPVLWRTRMALSFPTVMAVALVAASIVERRRGRGAIHPALVVLISLAITFAFAKLLQGEGDYGHVLDLIMAKLAHGGVKPDDPSALSHGARLLWQGPFRSGTLTEIWTGLGALGILLPVCLLGAVPGWLKGSGDARTLLLSAFAGCCLVAAMMVIRMLALLGLVMPVIAAVCLWQSRPRGVGLWMVGLVLGQAVPFEVGIKHYDISTWYSPWHQAAIAEGVEWIRDNLPHDGAIATDFMTSSAVLANTGHAVVLQPKYEVRESRDRIVTFLNGFYGQSPAEFRSLLLDEFAARYLLVDLPSIWADSYVAGVPLSAEEPPVGSAAREFLNDQYQVYAAVPGFRLLFEAPKGESIWRLYEIEGSM